MFTRKLSFTPIKYPKARAMGITSFPYFERDSNCNITYCESFDGEWDRNEYDSSGNETYYEDYNGYWVKREFDSTGKRIYYENSYGEIERY
jgi:hypothetical protein